MSSPTQSRLGAWSRRRAAVQAEADVLAQEDRQADIATQQEALAQKTETEVLAELDLPQPDHMQAGDDFTAFMKDTVPTVLRNRALRKLWLTNPVLANVDNLVDYGEDFAAEAKLGEVVKTIYRVGKGLLQDEEEQPDTALASVSEPEEPIVDDIEEDDIEEITEDALLTQEAPHEGVPFPAEEIVTPLAIKRKMKFRFAEGTTAIVGNE
ncbi:MAG: DUF3306 domain-containing protein [Amylibacter sp.]|nr:DUF3306 domain-containing protein [Amylibacter sp.]